MRGKPNISRRPTSRLPEHERLVFGHQKQRAVIKEPQANPERRAVSELSADKDTTVMVGDRKYDVLGAHRCGIPCIGVEYGYADPGEFAAAGAEYTVPSVDELCKLIRSKD